MTIAANQSTTQQIFVNRWTAQLSIAFTTAVVEARWAGTQHAGTHHAARSATDSAGADEMLLRADCYE